MIAEEVRAEAVRFGRERDPGGTVLFEVGDLGGGEIERQTEGESERDRHTQRQR